MNPPRLFGQRQVPLPELSDAELRAEVEQRRQRRAGRPPKPAAKPAAPDDTSKPPTRAPTPPSAAPPRQVRQWLANLELSPESTSEDVEAAYERLLARYAPAAEDPDPKRRATAKALLGSLKQAYDGVQRYLSQVQ